MNVNITRDAVIRAKSIVEETRRQLAANHAALSATVGGALSQWNDANVTKFCRVFENMTGDLNGILGGLQNADAFCDNILSWMSRYFD